ncbi:MAG TPA: rhodanese-like domain-containing protein [Flavobacteriales bacterium]|nr:rhodanese-like domain-containing protein [Flavobacteriales bacterium]
MKTITLGLTGIFCSYFLVTQSQNKQQDLGGMKEDMNTMLDKTATTYAKAKVDFNAYEKLVAEVKEHRAKRLVSLDDFLKMSNEENTIILDTRSDNMYERRHVKGAKHLSFTNFTQRNLDRLLRNKDLRILIYCNNNFDGDDETLPTKAAGPSNLMNNGKELTLALNIPTYINLYGYGYQNVYELDELVNVNDSRIKFEGTDVSN